MIRSRPSGTKGCGQRFRRNLTRQKILALHLFFLEVYFHRFEKYRLFSFLTQPYGLYVSFKVYQKAPCVHVCVFSMTRLSVCLRSSDLVKIFPGSKTWIVVILRKIRSNRHSHKLYCDLMLNNN